MNRDLEETLNELGPDYRAVVARLRASQRSRMKWPAYLTAASLLAVLGLAVVVFNSDNRTIEQSNNSICAPREYTLSVDEMIASQNPDGSWQNDFLTRRNADALRASPSPAARIAYKKAMRNLRSRGIL